MKQRIKSASWRIRQKKLPESARKGKETQKDEEGLKELQDSMKCNNIQIIGIPEGEEEERGIEHLFEKVMMENFPNW